MTVQKWADPNPDPEPGLWFDQRFRFASARYSLYCFPFAGGTATYFSDWAPRFTGAVELVPVQLPGRGPRLAEEPPTSIEEVADVVASAIELSPTRPLLFGHSMGAILAFEVARRLRTSDNPPGHLFVSGRPAPPQHRPFRSVSDLPHAEFIEVLREYGSIPEEILGNEELLDLLIPMMRADFSMIEKYRHRAAPPLWFPISAWCGSSDSEVTPAAMRDWAAETTEGMELFVRPGGHFFVSDAGPEIAKAVHDAVARLEGRLDDLAPPDRPEPVLPRMPGTGPGAR